MRDVFCAEDECVLEEPKQDLQMTGAGDFDESSYGVLIPFPSSSKLNKPTRQKRSAVR